MSRNTIETANSRAVSVIRSTAGMDGRWTGDEFRTMDTKMRKLLMSYRTLHPRADVDRLFLKRRDGRRGSIVVQNCVEVENGSLFPYPSGC